MADILEIAEAGDVVIVRYEGPEADLEWGDALPDQLSQVEGLGKACALIVDGRFSEGTSVVDRPVSLEAAGGGAIALIEPGDLIEIDILARTINVKLMKQRSTSAVQK